LITSEIPIARQLGDNVRAEILRFNTAELHAAKKSSRFRHTIDFWSHCVRLMESLKPNFPTPSEKNAGKLTCNIQQCTFSGPVLGQE
jgi:hypothetical protein